MPYLTLDGVQVRVTPDSGECTWQHLGGRPGTSHSGAVRGGPKARKREWTFTSTWLPMTDARELVQLVEGEGGPPTLSAAGDFVLATVQVQGEVTAVSTTRAAVGGALQSVQSVAFTLREV